MDGRSRYIVALDDSAALDASLTGRKAASLARAAGAGMRTLPGFVLTTSFAASVDEGGRSHLDAVLREVFTAANGDQIELVVRSSSVLEDTDGSSMAGQFESVVGTSGFDEFLAASAGLRTRPRRTDRRPFDRDPRRHRPRRPGRSPFLTT
jgi:pyruvate,water dikinase